MKKIYGVKLNVTLAMDVNLEVEAETEKEAIKKLEVIRDQYNDEIDKAIESHTLHNLVKKYHDNMYFDSGFSGTEFSESDVELIDQYYDYNHNCDDCGAKTCSEEAFFYRDEIYCPNCCPDLYGVA
jgi:formylmethanofuran dehydrogenase subunit E